MFCYFPLTFDSPFEKGQTLQLKNKRDAVVILYFQLQFKFLVSKNRKAVKLSLPFSLLICVCIGLVCLELTSIFRFVITITSVGFTRMPLEGAVPEYL